MIQDLILAEATSIHRLLAIQAERHGDAIAIGAPGRAPLTYRRLWRQVEDLVAGLNVLGIGRNDRVAIVQPNGPEMAVAFLGVASGATAAPLNPTYRTEEFDFYLSDLGAKALIVASGSDSPAIAAAEALGISIIELRPASDGEAGTMTVLGPPGASPAPLAGLAEPDDVALALHTSGTTSRPKLVPLTHVNLCASAANVRTALALTQADRCLNVMPLFHIHGLVTAVLASLLGGASVICTPGFYGPEFFGWMDECQPSWYTAVPTMHQTILARASKHHDIIQRRPLRFVRSASSSLPPQIMAQLEETFGAPVIEAYGMTEAAHQMASNPLPPNRRKPGSVGIPTGPEIAVMDSEGVLLPPGREGEVVIRGRNVTRGYENNPEANRVAFTNGWFRTGDQGCLDEDGYLSLTGRLKEIINRGGEKISPREVDEVLLDHPAVAQVVTFAIPDPNLGEDVGAVVVLRAGMAATEPELRGFAAARLADFKVPRTVLFRDEIPKGSTGKLQRIGLAERLGLDGLARPERNPARSYTAPRTQVEELVARLWAGVLRLEQVGVDDDFLDLGGDSMLATRLVSRIRKELGLELSLRSMFDAPTVAQQAELLLELLLRESEGSPVPSELNPP